MCIKISPNVKRTYAKAWLARADLENLIYLEMASITDNTFTPAYRTIGRKRNVTAKAGVAAPAGRALGQHGGLNFHAAQLEIKRIWKGTPQQRDD
ncbi:hypothetical protein EVAR_38392_1 [Eumeta japonica]|uniref:Uncharacterized protein n=1 Tax=Eumeta variegata TaxID=151549 RepID=A0A4C1YGX7_EUMVA|nr:hypothetical protein EVAR_38392_1 [Eumeta japonica]